MALHSKARGRVETGVGARAISPRNMEAGGCLPSRWWLPATSAKRRGLGRLLGRGEGRAENCRRDASTGGMIVMGLGGLQFYADANS